MGSEITGASDQVGSCCRRDAEYVTKGKERFGQRIGPHDPDCCTRDLTLQERPGLQAVQLRCGYLRCLRT